MGLGTRLNLLWPGNEAKFAKALTQYERPETKTVLFVITPDNHVGDWCSYIIMYNNKLNYMYLWGCLGGWAHQNSIKVKFTAWKFFYPSHILDLSLPSCPPLPPSPLLSPPSPFFSLLPPLSSLSPLPFLLFPPSPFFSLPLPFSPPSAFPSRISVALSSPS